VRTASPIVRTWALARTYRRGSIPVPVLTSVDLELRAGEYVKALQSALKAAGHDPGTIDGTFGAGTVAALEAWQGDQGLDETGTLGLSSFVSYPPDSVALQVLVKAGEQVGPQTTLATLGVPGGLVAQADVSQLDVSRLRPGQHAQLMFDALSGATTQATVTSIPAQAESTQSTAGSNTVVQYAVTVQPTSPPTGARAGMTGQASVVVVSQQGVVIVPTSAIGGSANTPTVEVMLDGEPVTRQVIVGLTTPSGTEIVAGVQPGQEVVTGVTASSQQSGTGTQTQTPTRQGGGFGGVVQ